MVKPTCYYTVQLLAIITEEILRGKYEVGQTMYHAKLYQFELMCQCNCLINMMVQIMINLLVKFTKLLSVKKPFANCPTNICSC